MLLFCLFYFYFEVLAESSKQLLDCAFERSRVTELLPQHGSLSAGVKTYPSPLSLKPDPTGPFTPGTRATFIFKSLTLPLSLCHPSLHADREWLLVPNFTLPVIKSANRLWILHQQYYVSLSSSERTFHKSWVTSSESKQICTIQPVRPCWRKSQKLST